MSGLVLTAAVSTPVGPPPQTTKLSNFFRSSGEIVGKLAISKLSANFHQVANRRKREEQAPKIRRRMAWASEIVFSWKECSRPVTP